MQRWLRPTKAEIHLVLEQSLISRKFSVAADVLRHWSLAAHAKA